MAELRNYQKGDEGKIFDLISSILSEYLLDIDPDETDSDLSDIERSYISSGGAFKVLVDNNNTIGSYGLYKIDNTTCELRKMYLNSTYRGRGFGILMMEDAFETAAGLDYKRMVLETNSVLKEAISLYKKYGFTEFKPDHMSCRCDIAMEKNLSPKNIKQKK